ncbi:MAG: glutathione S-transferase family protein [Sulfuricellaceae bacterium]
MNTLTLVIGNKNYSSWSLRPWLFMKHHGLAFDEILIPLYAEGSPAALRKYSPSGLVPLLIDGDLKVWDSLAICEYVSEKFLDGKGWPEDRRARAVARSVSAEMHAGFQKLRMSLPMNLRACFDWRDMGEDVGKDIARVVEIWEHCRTEYGADGPWLFGRFSIADAMYAPVAWRFHIYGVPLGEVAANYAKALVQLDEMQVWHAAAIEESAVLPQLEARALWPL